MIIKLKNLILVSFLSVLFSSCATLNKDECKTADWKLIGFEDGSKGYSAARIGEHRKACAEHGVSPKLQFYNQGRAEGLHKYCIPVNAFNLGRRGSAYKGVCSGYNEREFLSAYKQGKQLHVAKSELYDMQQTLEHKQKDIQQIVSDINQLEDLIVNGKLPKTKAISLLNETKELAVQKGNIEKEIHDLQHDIEEQTSYISELKQRYQR